MGRGWAIGTHETFLGCLVTADRWTGPFAPHRA